MKKKHKLLKEAYDNYPKGTVARFKSAPDVDHVSDGKFQIQTNICNGTVVLSGNGQECFYASNEKEGEQWAEIIKDKKPLLISEDGVPLFEGDYYVCVKNLHGNGWEICFEQTLGASHFVITDAEICKAFSTKEAALAWIEAQQLKEIEVELFADGDFAKVSKKEIKITNPFTSLYLKPSDIEAISNALKTLSK